MRTCMSSGVRADLPYNMGDPTRVLHYPSPFLETGANQAIQHQSFRRSSMDGVRPFPSCPHVRLRIRLMLDHMGHHGPAKRGGGLTMARNKKNI